LNYINKVLIKNLLNEHSSYDDYYFRFPARISFALRILTFFRKKPKVFNDLHKNNWIDDLFTLVDSKINFAKSPWPSFFQKKINLLIMSNLLFFYQYSVSQGAKYFSINQQMQILGNIFGLFNCAGADFFKELYQTVPWSRFFINKLFGSEKNNPEILNIKLKIFLNELTQKRGFKSLSDLYDDFFYIHLIVRQYCLNERIEDAWIIDTLITEYTDLITDNPELEELYGITIEYDMLLLRKKMIDG
jgi:hypothetical protein